jgi:lambda family phage minor tail protein L
MVDTIAHVSQQPSPGTVIELFQFDASVLGGSLYHFTQGRYVSSAVAFNGVTYSPMDVEAEGWEWSGRGPLPTPTLRVSNVNRVFQSLVLTYEDLVNCVVTRIKTYTRFLDGQPDADPTQHWPLDVFEIQRKVAMNRLMIEWELSSMLDHEGKPLPARKVIRDTCPARYRRFVTGTTFDYTDATCPYSGASYFNREGEVVGSASLDACGRRVSDCKLHFGATAPLPFEGFPGVSRFRSPG